jgi:hypothetical protein
MNFYGKTIESKSKSLDVEEMNNDSEDEAVYINKFGVNKSSVEIRTNAGISRNSRYTNKGKDSKYEFKNTIVDLRP